MLYDKCFSRHHNIKMHSNQENRQLDLLLSFIWYHSLENERWKEIQGLDGRYFISDHGRVLSLCCDGYKLLQPFVCGSGYYYVDLRKDNQDIKSRVNRLVADAFVENPENKPIVHHKDNDKTNNYYQNLVFLTSQEHIELHRGKKDGQELLY